MLVTADLGGLLLIRDGVGCAQDIVGVGVICQGEASRPSHSGAGAAHPWSQRSGHLPSVPAPAPSHSLHAQLLVKPMPAAPLATVLIDDFRKTNMFTDDILQQY